jgi:hypothetical protein
LPAKRKNAEKAIKAALEHTALTPEFRGVHLEEIVYQTGLSEPGASKALKRLVQQNEVFAYVATGEYPKLSYRLKKNPYGLIPPESHIDQERRKHFRKYRRILDVLSTNRRYTSLQTKLTAKTLVETALVEQEVFYGSARLRGNLGGRLIGPTQQAIIDKLSREINSNYREVFFKDFQLARVRVVPTPSFSEIRNIVEQFFEQGLFRIAPCLVAAPSQNAYAQLEAECEAASSAMKRIREEVAQELRHKKTLRQTQIIKLPSP